MFNNFTVGSIIKHRVLSNESTTIVDPRRQPGPFVALSYRKYCQN